MCASHVSPCVRTLALDYCAVDYASSPTMYLSLSSMGTTLSTVPSPVVSSAIESGFVSMVVSSSWPGLSREKQRARIVRACGDAGEWC